jgi:hypothetical protein
LVTAAKLADGRRVRELVLGGAAVDTPDRRGYTPLMWAAALGSIELTAFLLERGAQVNWRAADGTTALYLAVANGAADVVKLLLARGADPAVVRNGSTPRQAALARGDADLAALLEQAEVVAARNPAALPAAGRASRSLEQGIAGRLAFLQDILGTLPTQSGEAAAAHRRAATALSELQKLAEKWPAGTPADYHENLVGATRALADAIARQDPDRLRGALVALAEDLDAKLEHCRKSGGRLGGSVLVRVRTVQAGTEAGRWQVFYMPKIFEVSPSASPDLFPQLSSPTEELLVPGRYLMWVRNPATATVGERTVVKIGEGRKELMVDLPVPASPGK